MKVIFIIILMAISVITDANANDLSDKEITQLLIDNSIASYSGQCACPYNVTKKGRSCGKSSAYSRQGGEDVLCYPSDVSKDMIEDYKNRHK